MTNYESPEPKGILCGNGHRHAGVAQVRACYFGKENPQEVTWASVAKEAGRAVPPSVPPAPSVAPALPPHVTRVSAPPTEAQRAAITRLGGRLASDANRLDASRMIDKLIENKAERERKLAEQVAREASAEEEATKMHSTMFGLPAEILFDIREGRFAVSISGTKKLDFVRVSIVKPARSGHRRHVGAMRVQTQHSDSLKDRAFITRDGQVHLTSNTMTADYLTQIFMGIISGQRDSAILYGREKGQCCRCGRELTDERSRHYGIGPECEKHWEEIVSEIDEAEGVYAPGKML